MPSSNGCASSAGELDPLERRAPRAAASRRNGEATASGWIAEQTSWTNPGSVSSADRMPPPTRRPRPRPRAPRKPGAREHDRRGEAVRARADDDRDPRADRPGTASSATIATTSSADERHEHRRRARAAPRTTTPRRSTRRTARSSGSSRRAARAARRSPGASTHQVSVQAMPATIVTTARTKRMISSSTSSGRERCRSGSERAEPRARARLDRRAERVAEAGAHRSCRAPTISRSTQ